MPGDPPERRLVFGQEPSEAAQQLLRLQAPTDTAAIGEALASLAAGNDLRRALQSRGIELASDYSWSGVSAKVARCLAEEA